MVRAQGKQKSTRLVLIVCVSLLGFGLIADYLWASSPHFATSSYISNWVSDDASKSNFIIPKHDSILPPKPLEKLLAEAMKQIFGSSKIINGDLNVDSNDLEGPSAGKTAKINDGEVPEWAQVLEPVRKLPTNVGARIRKCVHAALSRNPPAWAKKLLEYSISKEVYKGNASGPTKRAVITVLANVHGENLEQKPIRKRKGKSAGSLSDVIMKQCRKVLRLAVAADEDKVFCNLLGRTLFNTYDNDDEGLLGFPSMVSRPLDFRTIDLRLAFGAYGGSHEAFLEDVREVWHHICTVYADQSGLVHLAETLSQNFEKLYEKEVLTIVSKLTDYVKVESLSSDAKREMEDLVERASEIPKAPWDEGVCKICGIDKDDDNVLLCDKCDSGYHTYCLNPPLARIPEGNWYCPSCVTGHFITQASSNVPQFTGNFRKKRRQGEFTHGFLGDLAHLVGTMEVKDYWEYSVEERIFLLKLLGDEMLNSGNIREHLDQSASTSADLQQKLRSLYTELRNFKLREEVLAERVAKENSSVLNCNGKSGTGGARIVLPNYDKLMGQVHNKSSSCLFPKDLVSLEDNILWNRTNDIDKHTSWLHSNVISELHSCSNGSKFMKIHDSEYHVNLQDGMNNHLLFENSCSNRLPASVKDEIGVLNKLPSIPQQQKYDFHGDCAAWGDFNKELKKGSGLKVPACEVPHGHFSSGAIGTLVNSENQFPSHRSPVQLDADELQASNLEANFIKKKIAALQDSIAFVESQLQKVSLRKDFLGRDSAGRLYWIFFRPGSSPWVVVDGTMMVQKKSNVEERWELLSANLTLNSSLEGSNVSSPYSSEWTGGIRVSSQWFSYQSDAEIEDLIRWLRVNEPMERELLESLLQCLKVGDKGSDRTGNYAQDMCQPTSKTTNVEKTLSSTLLTKSLVALERKYGPCLEHNATDIILKQSRKEATYEERLYRCGCLELVWPSRYHCHVCHTSFPSSSGFREHNNGKCNSGVHASQNGKVSDGSKKGKAIMRTEEGNCSDKKRPDKSGTLANETGTGLGELPKGTPFNLDDVTAKFVTNGCMKKLVQEIGLIGSNGIPTFVPCVSPYLSDPTLKLTPTYIEEDNQSNKSSNVENQLQEPVEGNGITSKKNNNNSNNGSTTCTAGDINKEAQKVKRFFMSEKRASSKKFNCATLGNAKISAIRDSSLRPLVGRGTLVLRQLKINLLDMDAALPEEALKSSKASSEKRGTWREFVKSAKSVFEMVQATITLEDMIKTEYLKNEWWYWSSLSAAAKIATVSALALRIYTLDAAIIHEKTFPLSSPGDTVEVVSKSDSIPSPSLDATSIQKSGSTPVPRTRSLHQTDNGKPQSRSGKKRKDTRG